MHVEIIGKCKKCGYDVHYIIQPDSAEFSRLYKWYLKCDNCGYEPNDADFGTFNHLADVVVSMSDHNNLAEISKIVLHAG